MRSGSAQFQSEQKRRVQFGLSTKILNRVGMHERREIFYRLRLCIVEMIAWSEPTLGIHLLRSKFKNYIIVFFIRLDSSERAFNLDG